MIEHLSNRHRCTPQTNTESSRQTKSDVSLLIFGNRTRRQISTARRRTAREVIVVGVDDFVQLRKGVRSKIGAKSAVIETVGIDYLWSVSWPTSVKPKEPRVNLMDIIGNDWICYAEDDQGRACVCLPTHSCTLPWTHNFCKAIICALYFVPCVLCVCLRGRLLSHPPCPTSTATAHRSEEVHMPDVIYAVGAGKAHLLS